MNSASPTSPVAGVAAESVLPVLGAYAVAAWTPGPNNTICTAISANYGWRRAMPFALGVSVGHPLLMLVISLGLSSVFLRLPTLHLVVQILGAAYLLYLAWCIATAPPPEKSDSASVLGFWRGVIFQWVNPKGIAACISLSANYVRPEYLLTDTALLVLIAAGVTSSAVLGWSLFGAAIGPLLNNPVRLRWFNRSLAALLAIAVIGLLQ